MTAGMQAQEARLPGALTSQQPNTPTLGHFPTEAAGQMQSASQRSSLTGSQRKGKDEGRQAPKDELNLPLPPLHLDFSVKGDGSRPLSWQRYHRLGTLQDASAAVIGKGGFGTAYRFNRDDSFTPPESLSSTNHSSDQPSIAFHGRRSHQQHRSDEVDPALLRIHHPNQQHQPQQLPHHGMEDVTDLRRMAIFKTSEEGMPVSSSRAHYTHSAPASPILPAHPVKADLARSSSGGQAQPRSARAPAVIVVKVCRTPTNGSYDELPKTGFGRHEAKTAAQEIAAGNPVGQHTRIVRGEARLLRYLQLMHSLETSHLAHRPRLPIVKLLADLAHGDYDDGRNGPPVPRLLVFERLVDLDAELTPKGWARGKQLWTIEKVESVCKDVICGLKFLHDHHIAHGDLKPSNFMRDAKTGHVKLIDLGASRRWVRLHNAEKERTSAVEEFDCAVREGVVEPQLPGSIVCEGLGSLTGSPHFMAPEVLLQAGRYLAADGIARNLLDDYFVDKSRLPPVPSARLFDAAVDEFRRGWGTKADVWSWGCSVISLLLRTLPKDERPSYSTACPFDFSFEVNCDALEPMWELHESNATLPRFHQWARMYPLRIMETIYQGIKLPHYAALLSPPLREALQACFLLQLPRPSSSDICAFFEQMAILPSTTGNSEYAIKEHHRHHSLYQHEQQLPNHLIENRAASPALLSPTFSTHLLAGVRHPGNTSYVSHPDSIHNIDLASSVGGISEHQQAPATGASASAMMQSPIRPSHTLYNRPDQSQSQVALPSPALRPGPTADPFARYPGRSPVATTVGPARSPISAALPLEMHIERQQPLEQQRDEPTQHQPGADRQVYLDPFDEEDRRRSLQVAGTTMPTKPESQDRPHSPCHDFSPDQAMGSPRSPDQKHYEISASKPKEPQEEQLQRVVEEEREEKEKPIRPIETPSTLFSIPQVQPPDDDSEQSGEVRDRHFAKETTAERHKEPQKEQQHCDIDLRSGENSVLPKREPTKKKSTTLLKSLLPFHKSSGSHRLSQFPTSTPWKEGDRCEVEMLEETSSAPRQGTGDAEMSFVAESSGFSAQGQSINYPQPSEDQEGRSMHSDGGPFHPPPPILVPPHKRTQKERSSRRPSGPPDPTLSSELPLQRETNATEHTDTAGPSIVKSIASQARSTSSPIETSRSRSKTALRRSNQSHQRTDTPETSASPASLTIKKPSRLRVSRSFASIQEAAQHAGHFISSALAPGRLSKPSPPKSSCVNATSSTTSQTSSRTGTTSSSSMVLTAAGQAFDADQVNVDLEDSRSYTAEVGASEEVLAPVVDGQATPVAAPLFSGSHASIEHRTTTLTSPTARSHPDHNEVGCGGVGASTSSSPSSNTSSTGGRKAKTFSLMFLRSASHSKKAG